jgi:hypothetical protein
MIGVGKMHGAGRPEHMPNPKRVGPIEFLGIWGYEYPLKYVEVLLLGPKNTRLVMSILHDANLIQYILSQYMPAMHSLKLTAFQQITSRKKVVPHSYKMVYEPIGNSRILKWRYCTI